MSNKTKVMISQPMAGKTKDEIADERKRVAELLKIKKVDDFEIMDTTVPDYMKKSDLECFSESIKFMSQADVLVMGIGWEKARGCKLEHEIAEQYNLKIIYLDTNPFITGIYEYTSPSCHSCPALQSGDICDLQYANNLINNQREEIKRYLSLNKNDCLNRVRSAFGMYSIYFIKDDWSFKDKLLFRDIRDNILKLIEDEFEKELEE